MPKKSTRNLSDQERLAAILRPGAGRMDTRPRGQRCRSGQKRAALRDQG